MDTFWLAKSFFLTFHQRSDHNLNQVSWEKVSRYESNRSNSISGRTFWNPAHSQFPSSSALNRILTKIIYVERPLVGYRSHAHRSCCYQSNNVSSYTISTLYREYTGNLDHVLFLLEQFCKNIGNENSWKFENTKNNPNVTLDMA